MKPRALFVTDFDGTLVSFESGSLPDVNRRAIERATNEGVAIAIASGRRRGSFRKDRHRLHGLQYRVSLSNGAVLLAPDNDTPAQVHDFAWSGALRLAEIAGEGVHALLAIAAPQDELLDCYVFRSRGDCHVFRSDGSLFAAGNPWKPETHVPARLEEATSRRLVHAALHVASRELAEELEPEARAIFASEGADVEVHAVRSPGGGGALLEVVVSGGKGRAVRDLAGELGIPFERTGAIGDDMNDARLIDAVAHRYAVGGTVLAERRSDVTVTRNAAEGAVADALERFLRELQES